MVAGVDLDPAAAARLGHVRVGPAGGDVAVFDVGRLSV